jgi:hypothetical protein
MPANAVSEPETKPSRGFIIIQRGTRMGFPGKTTHQKNYLFKGS